ncbi:MAG: hypothetical protein ACTSWY_13765, partial [Promethearchaeota archaeon]
IELKEKITVEAEKRKSIQKEQKDINNKLLERKEETVKEENKISEKNLRQMYNKETGKTANFRGKITSIYLSWRENKLEELGRELEPTNKK